MDGEARRIGWSYSLRCTCQAHGTSDRAIAQHARLFNLMNQRLIRDRKFSGELPALCLPYTALHYKTLISSNIKTPLGIIPT